MVLMGAAAISVPYRLSENLRENAEETGYLPEELGVEFVRKGKMKNKNTRRAVTNIKNILMNSALLISR